MNEKLPFTVTNKERISDNEMPAQVEEGITIPNEENNVIPNLTKPQRIQLREELSKHVRLGPMTEVDDISESEK